MKEKTQLNNQKVDVVKPEKTSLEEFSKDVFDMDFNFDDFNTNISESFEMLTEEVSSAIKAVEAFQKEEAPIEPEAPLETKEETSLLQRSSLNVAKKNSFADSCKSFFQKIGSKVARFLQALVENIQYAFGSLRFYGKIWSIGLVNFVKRNSEKAKQLQESKKHYLEAKARSADAKKPREKTESFFSIEEADETSDALEHLAIESAKNASKTIAEAGPSIQDETAKEKDTADSIQTVNEIKNVILRSKSQAEDWFKEQKAFHVEKQQLQKAEGAAIKEARRIAQLRAEEERRQEQEARRAEKEAQRKAEEAAAKAAEKVRYEQSLDDSASIAAQVMQDAERVALEESMRAAEAFSQAALEAQRQAHIQEEENLRIAKEIAGETLRKQKEEASRKKVEARAKKRQAAAEKRKAYIAEKKAAVQGVFDRVKEAAEERKAAKEAKRLEAEALRLAEEKRRAEEAEARRQEEERRKAEEEALRLAEEKRLAEEAEARRLEEERLEEEKKARLAVEAEVLKRTEEARKAREREKANQEAIKAAEERLARRKAALSNRKQKAPKRKEKTPRRGLQILAHGYYTWAVVWDQLEEERAAKKDEKRIDRRNKKVRKQWQKRQKKQM